MALKKIKKTKDGLTFKEDLGSKLVETEKQSNVTATGMPFISKPKEEVVDTWALELERRAKANLSKNIKAKANKVNPLNKVLPN